MWLAFAGLVRMKHLRGTPFDPFGRDPDRRLERAVVDEYERLLLDVTRPGAGVTYETQVALARSAQEIKGYGPIKEAAVARWRADVAARRRGGGTGG